MYNKTTTTSNQSTFPEFISHIHQPAQRVAVFIDTQNLYHSAKSLYGSRVNFANVLRASLAGRQLVRAIAYVISSQEGVETSFFEALQDMGIEIKTKDLQIFVDGSKKGDWDVGIAVDALSLANKVDTIILVTGDGDFVPLVECLQNYGVRVEVASFGKSTSARLIESSHEFFDLSHELPHMIFGTRRFIKPNYQRNMYTQPQVPNVLPPSTTITKNNPKSQPIQQKHAPVKSLVTSEKKILAKQKEVKNPVKQNPISKKEKVPTKTKKKD